jgi:hypothetical protein
MWSSRNYFKTCFVAEDVPPPVPVNPCQPSPCGPNSQCKVSGDSPSCSCLPNFQGSPPNCRPECVSNSECANHLACINQKCTDPCPGTCGSNAECRVISHTPNCVCLLNYVGDPFSQCIPKPRKIIIFDQYVLLTTDICSDCSCRASVAMFTVSVRS